MVLIITCLCFFSQGDQGGKGEKVNGQKSEICSGEKFISSWFVTHRYRCCFFQGDRGTKGYKVCSPVLSLKFCSPMLLIYESTFNLLLISYAFRFISKGDKGERGRDGIDGRKVSYIVQRPIPAPDRSVFLKGQDDVDDSNPLCFLSLLLLGWSWFPWSCRL